ncbi:PREDICTED: UPF0481 protein At3g47200-like [Nelumbo nucifera]|uniref:UPF0481 protein At3g47200-like n=2 Tax=Nelumbo nucifera TaxID=4432 RepID=A0A1U8Q841_NELNU|nr:PREDICTED: UPF0481 protein At3g47200-like [Nelumbo nucifera]XP_019054772.1 PREDICTED: UPF0481 protein At3g47200-like [Nelumbo nucifera]DAD29336.1 TPA_asm: hypothetical protein HUJ06_030804 [Nelumbo nucifera]
MAENINHNDWLLSIQNPELENGKSKTKFPKVPEKLKRVEGNSIFYDPQVVSIGPYHHGNARLEEMEKLKRKIAKMLVSERRMLEGQTQTSTQVSTGDIDNLYQNVKMKATGVKKSYDESLLPEKFTDDEEFNHAIFLDGCFVVYFIHCVTHNKLKNWEVKNEDLLSIGTDLFLLENQLPYFFLDELMKEAFPKDAQDGIFDKFIDKLICFGSSGRQKHQKNDKFIEHLLDLFRKKLVVDEGDKYQSRFDFKYLLVYFWDCFPAAHNTDEEHILWHSIRSADELKEVGINFKKSKSFNLNSIRFQRGLIFGDLTLPPIVIDHSTRPLFLNLLAYEITSLQGDSKVASFICFLDSLIDQASDVRVLRSDGVLLNSLSKDEEAAELINHLAMEVVDSNDFSHVTKDLKMYIQHYWRVRFAEIYRKHFSTPWTMIAFFGAIFITILTIIQTYFAIFPRN